MGVPLPPPPLARAALGWPDSRSLVPSHRYRHHHSAPCPPRRHRSSCSATATAITSTATAAAAISKEISDRQTGSNKEGKHGMDRLWDINTGRMSTRLFTDKNGAGGVKRKNEIQQRYINDIVPSTPGIRYGEEANGASLVTREDWAE